MARVRIEFVRLGRGPNTESGGWVNMIESTHGVVSLEVTGVATAGASRPVVPAFGAYDRGHARMIVDADMVVVKGSDPTADPAAISMLIQPGFDGLLAVNQGDLLSFVTVPGL